MIQRCNGPGLASEALAELGFGGLDGYDAVQPRVAGLPHFAHATCPDWREYLVRPQLIARSKRHILLVLVQREVENARSPLASIALFAAVETATGFKKEIRLG